jgi:type II secretory pathway component GspD/PulD (secretin)
MAVIDATIIRTDESSSTARGINLLQGLQVVFGISRALTRTTDVAGTVTSTSTLNRSAGLPQAGVTYSLNLANAADLRTDVLARPSLVALDRQPSVFFSGTNVTIAIPGQLSGGNIVEKPIGVSLSVTPTFIDDDSLLLAVKAARSDVEPGVPGTFEQTLNTTRNMVTSNVRIRYGQTLVLSGLAVKETNSSKSGVPFLRGIPGLQYLFSTAATEENQSSLIITLTPRRPNAAGADDAGAEASADSPVAEVRARLARDFAFPPHLLAALRSLGANRYVGQFRSGDLKDEEWNTRSLLERLTRGLGSFIFY